MESKTTKLSAEDGANVNAINHEGLTPLIKLISLEEQPVRIKLKVVMNKEILEWNSFIVDSVTILILKYFK